MEFSTRSYKPFFILTLSIIVLLLGFASPYYFAQYGIDLGDEPYQILLAQDYHNSPLSFLSAWMAGCWGKIFGWGFLSMRFYAISIQLVGYAAACGFMYRHLRTAWLCMLISGIGAYFLNGMFNFTLIGWDATSNCFITLTLIALLAYISNNSNQRLILLAVLTALTTCTRLPNGIVLPIIFVVLSAYFYNRITLKQYLYRSLVFIGIFAITMLLCIILVFGSPTCFIDALQQNTVSEHSAFTILLSWLMFFTSTIPNASYIWVLGLAFGYACSKTTHKHRIAIISATCTVGLIIYLNFLKTPAINGTSFFSTLMYGYFTYLTFFCIFRLPWYSKTEGKKLRINTTVIGLCSILFFSLAAGFGSNCPFLKIISIGLLPLTIVYAKRYETKALVFFSLFVIILFTPTLYAKKINKSYFDEGIAGATCCVNSNLLTGIKTHSERAEFLNTFHQAINENKDTEAIFIAHDAVRFMGYYLNGTLPKYDKHNWSGNLLNDTGFINSTLHQISVSKRPVSVFVMRYQTPDTTYSKMEQALDSLQPSDKTAFRDLQVYRFE